jgi:hypothetical protein
MRSVSNPEKYAAPEAVSSRAEVKAEQLACATSTSMTCCCCRARLSKVSVFSSVSLDLDRVPPVWLCVYESR